MKKLMQQIVVTAALAALTGLPGCAQEAVHVSQSDALKAAKQKVEPEYPVMAKQLRVEGSVQLWAQIGENGAVEEVKPVTGNALLMNAAVVAVKKWKFSPFLTDGKPVKAITELSFNFHL